MNDWLIREGNQLADEFESRGYLDPEMAEVIRRYLDQGNVDRAFQILDGVDVGEQKSQTETRRAER